MAKEPEPREDWVNVQQAATILGTSINGIYLRHSKKKIPQAAKLDGRCWWRKSDIEEAAIPRTRVRS